MNQFEEEIRALRERTDANRRDFLRAEVQTCFIAIERGRFELSLGVIDEAKKEFEIAHRGTEVIQKFLGEAGRIPEIEQKLAELEAALASFRSDLNTYPG